MLSAAHITVFVPADCKHFWLANSQVRPHDSTYLQAIFALSRKNYMEYRKYTYSISQVERTHGDLDWINLNASVWVCCKTAVRGGNSRLAWNGRQRHFDERIPQFWSVTRANQSRNMSQQAFRCFACILWQSLNGWNILQHVFHCKSFHFKTAKA